LQTDEPQPTDDDFTTIHARLLGQTKNQDIVANLRTHCDKWARWLRQGVTDILSALDASVASYLPSIAAVWTADGTLSAISNILS
jgi:hypothetical protein